MPRLLVIDDSPTIRKLVEISFHATDWIAEFAITGNDGVLRAGAHVPDLILLDFVLPDMRGTDVCARLASDPNASKTPIIIMSGKADGVRELFRGFPAVADFVGKPFAPADLVARANAVVRTEQTAQARLRASLPPKRGFDFKQKETAARIIFGKLRPHLARIPELMAGLGAAEPASYFARKLLTPGLVTELLDDLAPLVLEALGPVQGQPGAPGAFAGSLGSMELLDLLALVSRSDRSGELSLRWADQHAVVFVLKGEIAFVTNHDPKAYFSGSEHLLGSVRADIVARAEAEHRATGKPLPVTLAELGALSGEDLGSLLCEHGKRVLVEAALSTSLSFSWRDSTARPLYVDAYRRTIDLSQMALERMRRDSAGAAARLPIGPDSALERAPGFSKTVAKLTLRDDERHLLTLVDGRAPLRRLAAHAGLSIDQATRVARRLAWVNLLREAEEAPTWQRGPVLVIDPDTTAFQPALRELMRARRTPVDVVTSQDADVVASVFKERPRMVVVNATAYRDRALDAAKAVRSSGTLAEVPLVAVLEFSSHDLSEALIAAGFDATLVKPVHITDLERHLTT